ncbi:MAG: hypothetical protein U0640_13120 [Phycisphaerales bacterium]
MHPYSTNSPAPPKHIAYMMLAAVALSAGVGWIAEYANARLGWALGSVSAMTLFTGLYIIFDRVVWKYRWIRRVLLVPDINGTWICEGLTLYKGGRSNENAWSGKIIIRQSWSSITIRLKTGQSTSESIAASLYCEPGNGYRLIYHYDNRPGIGETKLDRHCGLASLLFNEDVNSAEGEYFTDKDRMTSGTMRLTREGASSGKA